MESLLIPILKYILFSVSLGDCFGSNIPSFYQVNKYVDVTESLAEKGLAEHIANMLLYARYSKSFLMLYYTFHFISLLG